MRAHRAPGAADPCSNGAEDAKADGEYHAQKCGVFDEGRSFFVLMKAPQYPVHSLPRCAVVALGTTKDGPEPELSKSPIVACFADQP